MVLKKIPRTRIVALLLTNAIARDAFHSHFKSVGHCGMRLCLNVLWNFCRYFMH